MQIVSLHLLTASKVCGNCNPLICMTSWKTPIPPLPIECSRLNKYNKNSVISSPPYGNKTLLLGKVKPSSIQTTWVFDAPISTTRAEFLAAP